MSLGSFEHEISGAIDTEHGPKNKKKRMTWVWCSKALRPTKSLSLADRQSYGMVRVVQRGAVLSESKGNSAVTLKRIMLKS